MESCGIALGKDESATVGADDVLAQMTDLMADGCPLTDPRLVRLSQRLDTIIFPEFLFLASAETA